MVETKNKLLLKFEGQKLQEGVIDIYDLSSTIIALGNTIESISGLSGYTKDNRLKIDVSALRPGSFEVEIIVNFEAIKEAAFIAGAILSTPGAIDNAKKVLEILKDLIALKKFLKGEKPTEVKINAVGLKPQVTVYNFNGDNMTINMPVYNAAQDKTINRHIHDIYKPLTKEDGNIDTIELKLKDDKKKLTEDVGSVTKEEINYFEDTGELQSIKDYKIKAIVSRLDSKTGNGFLTIGSKRVGFELGGIDPNQYDESFIILAESLKLKLPIFITGSATLDFESNLKKISITKVESEAKLF
jgi:hypothetical protein